MSERRVERDGTAEASTRSHRALGALVGSLNFIQTQLNSNGRFFMQESDLLFILCITYDLNFLKYALEAVGKTELEENRSVRGEICQKCSSE